MILRPPRYTHFPYTTLFRSTHSLRFKELMDTKITTQSCCCVIELDQQLLSLGFAQQLQIGKVPFRRIHDFFQRSEEHTSELQSHSDLVCRLLLEKKKQYRKP